MAFPDDNDTDPREHGLTIVEPNPLGKRAFEKDESAPPPTDPLLTDSQATADDESGARDEEEPGLNEDATVLLNSADVGNFRPRLVVVQGPDVGAEHELVGASIVVGRSLGCDVVVNDPSASRRHFRLDEIAGTYQLVDLGSGNGTEVDGAPTDETDLLHNAYIKLGTTLFRFVLPGGPPSQEAPPEPVVKLPEKKPTPVPEATFDTPRPSHVEPWRPPSVFFFVFIVLGIAGGWYVGEAYLGLWDLAGLGDRPSREVSKEDRDNPADKDELSAHLSGQDGDPSSSSSETTGASSPEELSAGSSGLAVSTLMKQGVDAASEGRWDEAQTLFEKAREQGAGAEGLEQYLVRAQEEKMFLERVRKAEERIKTEEYKVALDALRTIPPSASAYAESQSLIAKTRSAFIRMQLDAARTAMQARDRRGAEVSLNAVFLEDKAHPEALDLKREMRRGLSKAAAYVRADLPTDEVRERVPAAKKEVDKESEMPAPDLEKDLKEPVPDKREADTTVALGLYRSGDFGAALQALRKEAEKSVGDAEKRRFKKLILAMQQFQSNYDKGKTARKAGQATRPLEKAYKADVILGRHYAFELRGLLADRYAKRAAASYAKQAYGTAAVFARKALKYDSENINARGVADKCLQKATLLMVEGDRAYAQGDKDEALGVYKLILQIDPSNGTARSRVDELTP